MHAYSTVMLSIILAQGLVLPTLSWAFPQQLIYSKSSSRDTSMGQPDVEDPSLEDSFPGWLKVVPNWQVKLAMIETSSSALSSTDRVVISSLSHSWSPGNSWWFRIFTVTRLPEICKVGTVPTFWISEHLLIRSQPTVSMANEQEVKFVPI